MGLATDLVSKYVVFRFLSRLEKTSFQYDVWSDVFRLSRHWNPGGPFSILQGHTWLLVTISVIALGIILYLYLAMANHGGKWGLVSLAMIAAGALGNLFDRLHFGDVRDFLDFCIINYPVFNVADVLITLGAALLIVELLRRDPSKAMGR